MRNPLGAPTWRWSGATLPQTLQLSGVPDSALRVTLRYRSAQAESAKLPVQIDRKLYRLVAQSATAAKSATAATPPEGSDNRAAGGAQALAGQATEFTLELVKDSDIQANALYMEEIRLTAQGEAPRYGLLEVPLPPGADVERGTWGIRIRNLDGDGQLISIDRARSQPGSLSYAVPIDALKANTPIRHLLRFGSKGSFVLPPARFYRMYQPEEKAFEAAARRVQVR